MKYIQSRYYERQNRKDGNLFRLNLFWSNLSCNL